MRTVINKKVSHQKTTSKVLQVVLISLILGTMAKAGTISGQVTGTSGVSVVYIDVIAGKTFPSPVEHPVMAQTHLLFEPHILPVQQGTTVDFLNNDAVAHNIFWFSVGGNKKLGHNLGTWPQSEKRSFKFDALGSVPLLCNVHPEMSGFIVVVPTPYFALTSETGEYKIENVPDGTYSLTVWHPGTKNKSQPLKLAGDAKADFNVAQ
jgi:plastocyanin